MPLRDGDRIEIDGTVVRGLYLDRSGDYDALRDKVKKIGEKQGVDKILVPLAVYLAERHNLI